MRSRIGSAAARVAVLGLVLVGLWALWEGYRKLWESTGWTRPFPVNATTMPHLHDIVGALFDPIREGEPLLARYMLDAALFTAKEAAVGFAIGATIGFLLGALIARFGVLQRGVMPYVVASQTIPILALAPIVVVGLGNVSIVRVDAEGLDARGRDRGLPDVLPRHGEHRARAAIGRSRRRRADGVVRGARVVGVLEAARAGGDAVPLLGVQGRRDCVRRRRDHRGAAVVDPGRARRLDHQLQPVLRAPAGEPVGGQPRRGAARDLVLPRRRARREARRPPRTGDSSCERDEAVVTARGVSKTFGKGGVTALQDIELEVGRGEFISLIGPSGCGKSTLLRVIGDLVEPSAGEILVNGKTAHRARLDRDYGIVFQAAVLYDWRTVAKNIGLPLELMGYSRQERAGRVRELMQLMELDGFEKHYPWQLSGGMQQRVSIARALSFSPALLLMDEPFGALDEMTRERLNLELLRIWSELGSTVIFVTHSISEAVFLSTRVVVMSARPGRITSVIPIDLPQPRTFETREEPRFFELVTEVREALHAGGVE